MRWAGTRNNLNSTLEAIESVFAALSTGIGLCDENTRKLIEAKMREIFWNWLECVLLKLKFFFSEYVLTTLSGDSWAAKPGPELTLLKMVLEDMDQNGKIKDSKILSAH